MRKTESEEPGYLNLDIQHKDVVSVWNEDGRVRCNNCDSVNEGNVRTYFEHYLGMIYRVHFDIAGVASHLCSLLSLVCGEG